MRSWRTSGRDDAYAVLSKVDTNEERSSLLWAGNAAEAEEKTGRLVKAAFYGVQVFYSFFIM
jgi:hypothetical protein